MPFFTAIGSSGSLLATELIPARTVRSLLGGVRMKSIVYLVGVIVIVLAILSLLGLR